MTIVRHYCDGCNAFVGRYPHRSDCDVAEVWEIEYDDGEVIRRELLGKDEAEDAPIKGKE